MLEQEDNLKMLRMEAYRLSELALNSDASAANVADQRANSFSGMALTGAALLTGLNDPETTNVGLLLAAFILVAASGVAAFTTRPKNFYYPGARFSDFDPDIEANIPFENSLVELARFNDKHSRYNRDVLEKNAQLLTIAYRIAIGGVIFGILSQLLF